MQKFRTTFEVWSSSSFNSVPLNYNNYNMSNTSQHNGVQLYYKE